MVSGTVWRKNRRRADDSGDAYSEHVWFMALNAYAWNGSVPLDSGGSRLSGGVTTVNCSVKPIVADSWSSTRTNKPSRSPRWSGMMLPGCSLASAAASCGDRGAAKPA